MAPRFSSFTVAVKVPLKAKHLACTLQLLLGIPLKERSWHITVAIGGPLESRVLTHYSC